MSQGSEQISSAIQDIGNQAAEAVSKAISEVAHGGLEKFVNEEKLKEVGQRIETVVRKTPWQAVSIALLIGVLVGITIKTR